jgi:hypothetical protein
LRPAECSIAGAKLHLAETSSSTKCLLRKSTSGRIAFQATDQVREVTEMAEVAPHTVSRFETEQGELRHDTATRLEAALAEPGVISTTDAYARACIYYQPLKPEAGNA